MLCEIFDPSPCLVPSMSSTSSVDRAATDMAGPKASCIAYLQRVPPPSDLEEFYARAKESVAASSQAMLEDDGGQLLHFFIAGGMRLDQTAYCVDVSFQWIARTRPFERYLVGSFEIPTSILTDASLRDIHLTSALIRDALILSIIRGCIYHLTVSVPPPKVKRTKPLGRRQVPIAQRFIFLSRKRPGYETPCPGDIERIVLAAEVKYCRDCGEWIPFEVVRAQCAGHSYAEGMYSD